MIPAEFFQNRNGAEPGTNTTVPGSHFYIRSTSFWVIRLILPLMVSMPVSLKGIRTIEAVKFRSL